MGRVRFPPRPRSDQHKHKNSKIMTISCPHDLGKRATVRAMTQPGTAPTHYVLSENAGQATRDLLLGKRIVSVEQGNFDTPSKWAKAKGRMRLDDGTDVLIAPNEGGCSCGAGDYELTHLASVDNIITDVRLAAETREDQKDYFEPDKVYRIYVIADAVEINAVSVEGNDGNGYYGTGYELFVIPPGARG